MAYQPKSYRKFLTASVAAAMVATVAAPLAPTSVEAAAPTFSDVVAGQYYTEAVTQMAAAEMINGIGGGKFGTTNELLRRDAAVLFSRSLLWETKDVAAPAFTDVPAGQYYTDAIAKAVELGVITGKTASTFAPNDKLTRGDMAVLLQRALKLTVDPEVEVPFTDIEGKYYTEAVKAVYQAGLTTGATATTFNPTGTVTRAQFATFLYRSELVQENVKAEIKRIEDAKIGEAVVTKVEAKNATQVVVNFNVEVNESSARILANYSINGVNPSGVALNSDKKSVTLTFTNASDVEVSNRVLTVQPVTTAKDSLVSTKLYTTVFSYKDEVKPEIVSVESVTSGNTASTLTIKASEPILAAVLKVNGANVSINFNGSDTATVTGLSLDATKAHTVEIINLTDKATTANITAYTSKTFTPVVDKELPTATLSAQSDKQILVTFSKAMNVNSVTSALQNGVVKNESLAGVTSLTATLVPNSGNKQFLISVTENLFANTNTRTLYVVLPNSIEDSLGNKLTATTTSVTLTKDTVKPAAQGFSVERDANGNVTKLVVDFSEGLAAANAGTLAAPTVIDQNGVLVTSLLGGLTSDAVTAGDKKVKYTVATPGKLTGTYTFNFAGSLVSDRAETPNRSDAFTYNFDFGAGAAAPSTFTLANNAVTNPSGTKNVIQVNFGTPVLGGAVLNSATALSSYTLNGLALPEGTTITLSANREVATITLPSVDSVKANDDTAVFTVANVKAVNGAMLNTAVRTVAIEDNTAPTLTAAQVIGNSIYLTFDEALDPATAADANIAAVLLNYKITSGSNTVVAGSGVATTTVVPNSGNKQLVITFTNTTDTNFNASQTITVETLSTGDLTDANNIKVRAGVKVTATK
ncbi:S-layer homology domain-containing protein [Anaerobacillus alkaliphilus]|uniref:S-layer homology domain-containing protein n=1 Tax=Anaerobacillus alkaliphilus TaxID=1548597 RepID=A0A4V1LGS0_9BACI|nr:S-layer homology domain-containing protein [Anaerobacillus alkaliphilus]RXJ02939.1 S-layer homology domain-containing protein [Anaerobacillus alkaliphilus]